MMREACVLNNLVSGEINNQGNWQDCQAVLKNPTEVSGKVSPVITIVFFLQSCSASRKFSLARAGILADEYGGGRVEPKR